MFPGGYPGLGDAPGAVLTATLCSGPCVGAVVTNPPFGADFQPCSAEQPRSGVADGVRVMARQHRVTGPPRLCQASRQQQPTAGSSACWQEQPSASDERSSIAGTERCAFASLLCGGDEPHSRTRSLSLPVWATSICCITPSWQRLFSAPRNVLCPWFWKKSGTSDP